VTVAGKVWGFTSPIFETATYELHRLEVHGGHRCSRHFHRAKFNGLFVESGEVLVTVWQPEGAADMTLLKKGESLIVPPGVDHMFQGITVHSVMFETYWTELRADDIVRKNSGE
jgi:mannose-6-phosphate isomerase-like protein (cupin superfamily)